MLKFCEAPYKNAYEATLDSNTVGYHEYLFKTLFHLYFDLSAVLLAMASALFAVRIVLVVWRHFKQPLYEDVSPELMEPMEIAEKQKKIFC